MVIKTIDNPPVKNMTGDSIAKKPVKDIIEYSAAENSTAENSVAKNTSKDSTAKNISAENYYFHSNKRSQAKNNAYVITKATIKDKSVKICGYDEEGLLVGWGMNNRVIYSRVDNECIAGWFGMMCENDNRVVGEILRSVEGYRNRHSKAKEIVGDSVAKKPVKNMTKQSTAKNMAENIKINYKENNNER